MTDEPRRLRKRARSRPWLLFALALLAAAAIPAACWIIPYRLSHSEFSSYYTFGYVGDEYYYAARIQPLLAGSNAANPLNGFGDPAVRSPFFLDDACRGIAAATGLDAPMFFWLWRIGFPVALALSFICLAQSCLPNRRRLWMTPPIFAASGAALAVVFLIYPLTIAYPPTHGWIHRVPTNIEYILSPLFAAALAAYIFSPTIRNGVLLGLAGTALIYLRPYFAVPWGMAAGVAVVITFAKTRAWKPPLITAVVLGVLLIPWLQVAAANAGSEAFIEMFARYYVLPAPGAKPPYAIHPEWLTFLIIAALLLVSAFYIRRARVFALSCGISLAVLPFITGLFSEASELHQYYRFGVYYLVALAATVVLIGGEFISRLRGRLSLLRARQITLGLSLLGLVGGALTALLYARLDLLNYPGGTLTAIINDEASIPGYEWLRKHSDPAALVLVDDGYDWSKLPRDEAGSAEVLQRLMLCDDLFPIVAQRRRLYHPRASAYPITSADLDALRTLQWATFGYPAPGGEVAAAIKKFRPDYIFWRKTPPFPAFTETAPIPRGFGNQWKKLSRVVYSDDACEIWKLEYGQ